MKTLNYLKSTKERFHLRKNRITFTDLRMKGNQVVAFIYVTWTKKKKAIKDINTIRKHNVISKLSLKKNLEDNTIPNIYIYI